MDSKTFKTLTSGCDTVRGWAVAASHEFRDKDLQETAHCLLQAERDCETLHDQITAARLEAERAQHARLEAERT